MTHQLIVVRHAKSAWDDPELDDFHRPLSLRGLNDIPNIAKWLKMQKLTVEQILSSTAKRARQTTQMLCKDADISSSKVDWRPTLYLADTATLLEAIGQTSAKTKNLMVVGHNPGLEELLTHLCGNTLPLAKNGKLLPTAAIAIVELADGWRDIKPHSAKLVQFMRPKELA